MTQISSRQATRAQTRRAGRHQIPGRQQNDLDTQFSNEFIAWLQKPSVEIINPKSKEKKKFLNARAYETIPLLSGFRRYLSVDALHQAKGSKYELVVKKESETVKDRLMQESSKTRSYSLKFSHNEHPGKIHSLKNIKLKNQPHQQNVMKSLALSSRNSSPRSNSKEFVRSEVVNFKTKVEEIMEKKSSGLYLEGSKIGHENLLKMSKTASMTFRAKDWQQIYGKGKVQYKTYGTQIRIEDEDC